MLIEIKNNKQLGEIGERITIGELSKYGIDIMLPMSDNLPFDFIIYYNNKFYKVQVKTSNSRTKTGSIEFSLTSNNWLKGDKYEYTKDDCDFFLLCDLTNVYLLPMDVAKGRKVFTINDQPYTKKISSVNYAEDYILTESRLKEVLI